MENKTLIPFDLERAKAGAALVTRDGRVATLDASVVGDENYPIYATIEAWDADGGGFCSFTAEGKYYKYGDENERDLFMAEAAPAEPELQAAAVPMSTDDAAFRDQLIRDLAHGWMVNQRETAGTLMDEIEVIMQRRKAMAL